MSEAQLEDKRIERERIKGDVKLEVMKQQKEMQLMNRKFDLLLTLNNKPVLSDHDFQVKLRLERELGLSAD